MRYKTASYVGAICIAALAALAYLLRFASAGSSASVRASAAFVLLGLICHAHSYRVAKGSTLGSIAFLPYLAAVTLSPTWVTAALVSLAAVLAETFFRRVRSGIKATFNVAQYSLSVSASVIAYRALGGESLLAGADVAVPAYVAAFVLFIGVNTLAVSGVIAVSEGRSVIAIWRQNTVGTLAYDALSLPVVYCFAVIYNAFDIAGVIFLGVLLLGARELYSKNRQLQATNQELLQVIIAAIDARDPYTCGHSQRVSEYSVIIARSLGLPARQVARIGVAALLHDVGKIHEMFAAILQKPGKLTAEERAIIEIHPLKSAELVGMVSDLADLVVPVRHHHENWDGTGYPDGLSGEDIPFTSRIIMFADTIDAMTTDRPYRKALGEAEVRAELLRCSGKQFDPQICEQLLRSVHFKSIFANRPPSAIPATEPSRLAMV
jgi:hypothetical protein